MPKEGGDQPTWQYDTLAQFMPPAIKNNHLLQKCAAEFIGTFFLVVFGVGAVCSSILAQQLTGLWQVAVLWGFGGAIAIYATASISGGHINPAVSLAFAILRPKQFPLRNLVPYWGAQMLGGIAGGFANLLLFYEFIRSFENVNDITRGDPKSVFTAMMFGEYFPNPTLTAFKPEEEGLAFNPPFNFTPFNAFLIEAWQAAVLVFVILSVTDARQKAIHPHAAPFIIGFTIGLLIALYGPMTQGGFNPARDFGPRLVAAMCGWGDVAIPGPRNGFWVYLIAPLLGGPVGGMFYDFFLGSGMDAVSQAEGGLQLQYCSVIPGNAEPLGDIDLGDGKVVFAKDYYTDRILYKKADGGMSGEGQVSLA